MTLVKESCSRFFGSWIPSGVKGSRVYFFYASDGGTPPGKRALSELRGPGTEACGPVSMVLEWRTFLWINDAPGLLLLHAEAVGLPARMRRREPSRTMTPTSRRTSGTFVRCGAARAGHQTFTRPRAGEGAYSSRRGLGGQRQRPRSMRRRRQ